MPTGRGGPPCRQAGRARQARSAAQRPPAPLAAGSTQHPRVHPPRSPTGQGHASATAPPSHRATAPQTHLQVDQRGGGVVDTGRKRGARREAGPARARTHQVAAAPRPHPPRMVGSQHPPVGQQLDAVHAAAGGAGSGWAEPGERGAGPSEQWAASLGTARGRSGAVLAAGPAPPHPPAPHLDAALLQVVLVGAHQAVQAARRQAAARAARRLPGARARAAATRRVGRRPAGHRRLRRSRRACRRRCSRCRCFCCGRLLAAARGAAAGQARRREAQRW